MRITAKATEIPTPTDSPMPIALLKLRFVTSSTCLFKTKTAVLRPKTNDKASKNQMMAAAF